MKILHVFHIFIFYILPTVKTFHGEIKEYLLIFNQIILEIRVRIIDVFMENFLFFSKFEKLDLVFCLVLLLIFDLDRPKFTQDERTLFTSNTFDLIERFYAI